MEFSKLSSPSLKDLFVREIENMIISGSLSVGDRLPPERELAEQMGVSRAVVNSGLSELSRKGFVGIQPRVGAFVADFHRKGTVETLLAILRYNGGMLRKQEIKSLLEIRLVIETLAIELAVPNLTAGNLAVLKNIIEKFGASTSPSESAELIFELHHEICILSENTLAPVIFYSFRILSTKLWERYFALYGNDALYQNTLELYGCLERGDVEGAVETFQSSLRKTIDGVVSIYQE